MIDFVNNQLLPKLRELSGSDEKAAIAALFRETYNRMLSGYLLRDLINLINSVHFQSKDEIFTLSHLYESMLKEMRDAAGDSGEFYTPRPVVQLHGGTRRAEVGRDACWTRPAARAAFWWKRLIICKPQRKKSADEAHAAKQDAATASRRSRCRICWAR